MRVRVVYAALFAVAGECTVAVAEPSQPTGDALRKMVSGKTVVISSEIGSLPIAYAANGTMSGKAQALGLITGKAQDSAHWWVAGDRLCQKWSSWLDNKSHCFTLRVNGTQVFWRRNDGKTGTAIIASR